MCHGNVLSFCTIRSRRSIVNNGLGQSTGSLELQYVLVLFELLICDAYLEGISLQQTICVSCDPDVWRAECQSLVISGSIRSVTDICASWKECA